MQILSEAGFDLDVVGVETRGTFAQRLARKFSWRPYPLTITGALLEAIINRSGKVIFLNLVDLAPLAKILRQRAHEQPPIVLLSHGTHSADELHKLKAGGLPQICINKRSSVRLLGAQLVAESEHREHIDHVFCLSELDSALERWVGAKNATWIPRMVRSSKVLDWYPVSGRMGFVGTLDHPPNFQGLVSFLSALTRVRSKKTALCIVGGPERTGRELGRRFPFVEYLGVLDDADLAHEAATWCCAIHPLFCFAGGCSMKLGVLLGWNIPVVTTPQGRRGYTWKQGRIPEADSVEGLASLALQCEDLAVARSYREEIGKVVRSTPTTLELARIVRQALSPLRLQS